MPHYQRALVSRIEPMYKKSKYSIHWLNSHNWLWQGVPSVQRLAEGNDWSLSLVSIHPTIAILIIKRDLLNSIIFNSTAEMYAWLVKVDLLMNRIMCSGMAVIEKWWLHQFMRKWILLILSFSEQFYDTENWNNFQNSPNNIDTSLNFDRELFKSLLESTIESC